ncbi:MAG TPA: hypothetical protein VII41_00640, partial [Steroidobacteraceae bacterium]
MKKALCAANTAAFLGSSVLFALLGAAVFCDSAMAQQAAPAAKPGTELEEIIVTAEKRESTVQATPIAMTALSAGDLTEQNITS